MTTNLIRNPVCEGWDSIIASNSDFVISYGCAAAAVMLRLRPCCGCGCGCGYGRAADAFVPIIALLI